MKNLNMWEEIFKKSILETQSDDASHDLGHFQRVYSIAKKIAEEESEPCDLEVILAAAYFHDIISLPKDHPQRHKSSELAAKKAKDILQKLDFPLEKIDHVCSCILTHSFSAGKEPQSLEAKIIQDADRMEALGALGVIRTFYVSGRLGREPYDPTDMFALNRELDDKLYGLDHFYIKLFKLSKMLQTDGGRKVAREKEVYLTDFIDALKDDVKKGKGGTLDIIEACLKAGAAKGPLFHGEDPFARKRELDPGKYALDRLQNSKEPFVSEFFTQIEKELI